MEAKKSCPDCRHTQEIIQEWMDQQGHDRCWYYPELFVKLVQKFGLSGRKAPSLPPRGEFEDGCKRYQDEEYSVVTLGSVS